MEWNQRAIISFLINRDELFMIHPAVRPLRPCDGRKKPAPSSREPPSLVPFGPMSKWEPIAGTSLIDAVGWRAFGIWWRARRDLKRPRPNAGRPKAINARWPVS